MIFCFVWFCYLFTFCKKKQHGIKIKIHKTSKEGGRRGTHNYIYIYIFLEWKNYFLLDFNILGKRKSWLNFEVLWMKSRFDLVFFFKIHKYERRQAFKNNPSPRLTACIFFPSFSDQQHGAFGRTKKKRTICCIYKIKAYCTVLYCTVRNDPVVPLKHDKIKQQHQKKESKNVISLHFKENNKK